MSKDKITFEQWQQFSPERKIEVGMEWAGAKLGGLTAAGMGMLVSTHILAQSIQDMSTPQAVVAGIVAFLATLGISKLGQEFGHSAGAITAAITNVGVEKVGKLAIHIKGATSKNVGELTDVKEQGVDK